MILYYAVDSDREHEILTSDCNSALEFFDDLLQKQYEYKDGIEDGDEAYLYKVDSYDLLDLAISTKNPYIEDILDDGKYVKLIKKRGWTIDEEATKEYLEGYKDDISKAEYKYICKEIDIEIADIKEV